MCIFIISVKEVTTRPPRVDDRDDDDENAALWAIVGVASLAFVVVIIFACSNYKKMHKKKEKASDDVISLFHNIYNYFGSANITVKLMSFILHHCLRPYSICKTQIM